MCIQSLLVIDQIERHYTIQPLFVINFKSKESISFKIRSWHFSKSIFRIKLDLLIDQFLFHSSTDDHSIVINIEDNHRLSTLDCIKL